MHHDAPGGLGAQGDVRAINRINVGVAERRTAAEADVRPREKPEPHKEVLVRRGQREMIDDSGFAGFEVDQGKPVPRGFGLQVRPVCRRSQEASLKSLCAHWVRSILGRVVPV